MKFLTSAVMSVALGFALLGGAVEASAIPLVSPAGVATGSTGSGANVVQVRMGRHFEGGGFGGGDGIGLGIGIGILGGLLLNNTINNGYYSDGNCSQRFRSYDPQSETYLGYDGLRHHCS
jgi:BA14K-like protein